MSQLDNPGRKGYFDREIERAHRETKPDYECDWPGGCRCSVRWNGRYYRHTCGEPHDHLPVRGAKIE